ncbi:hypothetical protein PENSPDRAFT_725927 [Peniophora sp. CONT]|nr:hypothetical protein PENSPDRAFT_725927 [Peniophora sp. CONT]
MTVASSRSSSSSSSSDSGSEPDSPMPFCRPWKYLENPAADEWTRGPKEIHNFPNLGDFVVLSIDPVASVSHLDAAAKQAAKQMPKRKYIALALQTHGLPIHTKPTHPYDFLFVRKGRPQPRLPAVDTENSCFAILPNDTPVPDRPTVRPAHPLPWDDCYLDTTYGFPRPCRVTSVGRDYVPVLPMLDAEIIRIRNILQDHRSRLAAMSREQGDAWPQPFDFVTLPALNPPEASVAHIEPAEACVPVQSVERSHEPEQSAHLGADVVRDTSAASDEVSIIGSEDGSQDGRAPEREPEPGDEEELEMFLTFESMMNNVGKLRDPVVNVWYDLDMVTEIPDPVHFLEDVKRLNMIMDDAEIRLGLRSDPDAVERGSEHSSEDEEIESRRSVGTSAKVAAALNTETKSHKDISTDKSPKAARGLRARFGSATLIVVSRARTLARKLPFLRCKSEVKLTRPTSDGLRSLPTSTTLLSSRAMFLSPLNVDRTITLVYVEISGARPLPGSAMKDDFA